MEFINFDTEVRRISNQLPPEPRLVLIGSSTFWGSDTESICCALGVRLAQTKNLTLITGGVPGVGETVGRAFHQTREKRGEASQVFHVSPMGSDPWDYATTLHAGNTMLERREVLARLGRVCLALEGGPGTQHEATIALHHGSILIPVGRTGGAAAGLYRQTSCPGHLDAQHWKNLGDPDLELPRLVDSINHLVVSSLGSGN